MHRALELDFETECHNQRRQQLLAERASGGPHEQVRSKPSRLRNTRSCAILDSTLEEPLTYYKSLEPVKPHWPHTWRRLHLTEGIRVRDMDTVVAPSRDHLAKTKKGMLRTSSGSVTYSSTHATKVALDAQVLTQICGDGVPGGGHAWTPSRLAVEFQARTGRSGVWSHYDIGITNFLLVFPKTFDVFGPERQFVRLHRSTCLTLMDNVEDAMVRLAMCRQDGQIHYNISDKFYQDPNDKWAQRLGDFNFAEASPKAIRSELKRHRLKTAYIGSAATLTTQRTEAPMNARALTGFGFNLQVES